MRDDKVIFSLWTVYFIIFLLIGVIYTNGADRSVDTLKNVDLDKTKLFLTILENNLKVETSIIFLGICSLGLSNLYFLASNGAIFGISLKLSLKYTILHGIIEMSVFLMTAILANIIIKKLILKEDIQSEIKKIGLLYIFLIIAAVIEAYVSTLI